MPELKNKKITHKNKNKKVKKEHVKSEIKKYDKSIYSRWAMDALDSKL